MDEIDAICKQRGSSQSGTGVNDSVVNQLLSKIDGVDSLNNILLIGMTNRLDMIDDALLRPGRLEVHIEVSLPDEAGRVQILNIHTKEMRKSNRLHQNVSINKLAAATKNFSGAEIEGLVRSAASWAFNRGVVLSKSTDSKGFTAHSDGLQVTMDDFDLALEEVKAAFGVQENELSGCFPNGIIRWGHKFDHLVQNIQLQVRQLQETPEITVLPLLLHGFPGVGKTALAAHIALEAKFPFIKVISPENFVGHSESSNCNQIGNIFNDAYKSQLSIVILDCIEGLLDFTPIGPRFSNVILQAIKALVRKAPSQRGRKLLVIGTTSQMDFLVESGLASAFQVKFEIPRISTASELKAVLSERNRTHKDTFPEQEIDKLTHSSFNEIGIKELLYTVQAAAVMGSGRIDCELFLRCLEFAE